MVIKMYESFLKDNKLNINEESAKDFCDLYDAEDFDYHDLSEEYVEYSKTLKTRQAKDNNYKKAILVNNKNYVAKVLLYDHLKDKNNIIDTSKLPINTYNSESITYTEFLIGELNDIYKGLVEDDLINPFKDIDYYNISYESRIYLWISKQLYINYIEQLDFDSATRVGEKILAINPGDNFNILSSLPYMYINMDSLDIAGGFLNNTKYSQLERTLLSATLSFFKNDYDTAKSKLKSLNSSNDYIIDLLINNNYLFNINPEEENKEYEEASYLYINILLIGDSKLNKLRNFILNNIVEIYR